jgi:hypothetical protein
MRQTVGLPQGGSLFSQHIPDQFEISVAYVKLTDSNKKSDEDKLTNNRCIKWQLGHAAAASGKSRLMEL